MTTSSIEVLAVDAASGTAPDPAAFAAGAPVG
ncbi:MAG: hypothetical protein JWN95_506 [Frankiales bacterium]|nr:hypothetical protein [Frankiales bacterium]